MSSATSIAELEVQEGTEKGGEELTVVSPDLSSREKEALSEHEETIENGLKVFLDVGIALNEIRSKELYRVKYASFEEYCEGRWNFSRNYANRLIKAATVTQTLKDEGGFEVLPESEAQARPLTGLSKKRLIKGWEKLLKQTGNELPNGAEVEDFVEQYKEQIKSTRSNKDGRPKKVGSNRLKNAGNLLLKVEATLKELETAGAQESKKASEARNKVAEARRILSKLKN